MMFRQGCFLLATLALFGLLPSCASNGKKWNPDDYTVKSGDTLYSIAWRYEIDTDDFASWNGISTSTFIKPGQRLHTRKPANFDSQKRAQDERSIAYAPQTATKKKNTGSKQVNKKWIKAETGDTLYGISKQYDVSVERLAQLNQLKKPYVIQPGQTIFLKPLNTKTRPSSREPARVATKPEKPASTDKSYTRSQAISWPKTVRWQRPANGKIVKKFSRWRNDSKGIDIEGKTGNRIVAAADGKVVYSGNGLISYGNLIIIKHNKSFLSAYAYNRKLLVKEGDVVKAGQKIAEMGRELSPENPLYQAEETAEADSEGLEDIDSLAEDLDLNMDAGEVEPPVAETGDVSDEAGKEEGLDFDIDLSFDSAKEDEPDSVEFTPPEVVDEAPEVDVDMDSVEPDMVDQDSPLDIDLEDFDNLEVSDSAEEEETQGDGELADMDEVSTKLDLARAYVDMGDPDGAKSILDEVMEEGSEEQKEEARGILGQMA